MLVDDLEQGLDVVDAYAAEHLEIHTEDAAAWAARVRNAGAIFVGPYAPVCLGDYCAGSNHVLPTGGCACHSSGLSVRAFPKSVHVVDYSRAALEEVAGHVVTLAKPRTCPVTAPRVGPVRPMTWPPLREELRGIEPYGAPQLDVPVQLNVNENPYGPSPACVADIAAAVAAAAGTLNRYPDREFTELRDRARGVPRPRRHRRPGVGGERLQRGDAPAAAGLRRPGPDGAELRADVLDVSGVRPRHDDRAGSSGTARPTSRSTSTTRAT